MKMDPLAEVAHSAVVVAAQQLDAVYACELGSVGNALNSGIPGGRGKC